MRESSWRDESESERFDVERYGETLKCAWVVFDPEERGGTWTTFDTYELSVAGLLADGPTAQLLAKGFGKVLGAAARSLCTGEPPAWLNQPASAADLHAAVRSNDVDGVRRALDAGAPIEWLNPHGTTSLGAAAMLGSTEVALVLLERGADPKRAYGAGHDTPLHAAVRNGDRVLVRALLANGADLEARCNLLERPFADQVTPLVAGLMAKPCKLDVDFVRELVAAGADINAKDKAGATVVWRAAMSDDLEIVRYLLDAGAATGSVDTADGLMRMLVGRIYMCSEADTAGCAMCEFLIDRGARLDGKENDHPLERAVQAANARLVGAILRRRPDLATQFPDGRTTKPQILELLETARSASQPGAETVTATPEESRIAATAEAIFHHQAKSARAKTPNPVISASPAGVAPWMIGQRIELASDRVAITLDKRIRYAILALLPIGAFGMYWPLFRWGKTWPAIALCGGGLLLAYLGVRVAFATPWRGPSKIVATREALAIDQRTIPATGIRTIERAIDESSPATRRSQRTQTWSLVVTTTDGTQERLVLGRQSAYKSKQPLEQLVAAINHVLRG